MVISIDFDGTVVEHRYPKIGEEIPHATETLRQLMEAGHKLALRADTNEHSHNTRKIDADLYIDDCNIGGRFDWETAYRMIHDNLSYHTLIREAKRDAQKQAQEPEKKKKRWFGF